MNLFKTILKWRYIHKVYSAPYTSAARLAELSMAIHRKVRNTTKRKEKKKRSLQLNSTETGILMTQGVERLQSAYSFLVFWCWRQRKVFGSFRSTSFFTSNWTVWLSLGKNPASLSMENPSLSSHISQTQVQLSQQKDNSDQPPSFPPPFFANRWPNQKQLWIHPCGRTLN